MPDSPTRLEAWLLRLGSAGALIMMLGRGKRPWMLPLVLVLLGVAMLLLFLQGIHYVAPFIYMVF